MPGTDEKSVERRSKFAFCAKLSKAIYSIPELTVFWRQAAPQGRSVYHFILQTNMHLINPGTVTELTTITPPQRKSMAGRVFDIECTSCTISTNAVTVELAQPGNSAGIDSSRELSAKLACVLCLTNPDDRSLPQYQFISCVSESTQLVPGSQLTFSIPLAGEDATKVGSYGDMKLLCAMVTLDSENKLMRYSGTLVK